MRVLVSRSRKCFDPSMTRNEAVQLVADINSWPQWYAWPARANDGKVPLVWFTRKDGSTRIYHAYNLHDFHRVRLKLGKE